MIIFEELAGRVEIFLKNHHAHWHEQPAEAAVDLGIEQDGLNALALEEEASKIGFNPVIVARHFNKAAHRGSSS